MKKLKLIYLLFFIIILYACKKSTGLNMTIISGFVNNSTIDSLLLYDKDYKLVKTIYLKEDNTFVDTVEILKGYYFLGDMRTTTQIFLKPEDSLNITINYKKNIPEYSFFGIGASENNYLKHKREYDETFQKVEFYKYYLDLNETDFVRLVDSVVVEKTNFLNSYTNLKNQFKSLELLSIKFRRMSLLNNYIKWHGQFVKDTNFKVSENYPNPYENIEMSNEGLLIHPNYLNINYEYALSKLDKIKDGDELLSELEAIDVAIESQKIKEQLAYNKIISVIQKNNKLSNEVYSKYMTMVENEDYKEDIKKIYLERKKITRGVLSPSFEFYDINNTLITLESLKGKLVYINIWATWCIPCIKEIPALKNLETEFKNKNIYFVNICLKDRKENFKKVVKEKKLRGIQLFGPDENNDFFRKYFVTEIPRYILIDKDGKIIDGHADAPSNTKLKELILEELN